MKIKDLQNVMLSFAIKGQYAKELIAISVPYVFISRDEQEATKKLYEDGAKQDTPNLDIYRLDRMDSAGLPIPDGGYLHFQQGGQKVVCPLSLANDMEDLGFYLAVEELVEREGEENWKYRLVWSRNSSSHLELVGKRRLAARKYLGQAYFKVFGFYNPVARSIQGDKSPIQGSIVTLNFSGVISGDKYSENLPLLRDAKMVDADGHIQCILRDPQAVAAYKAAAEVIERHGTVSSPSPESQKSAI